jgi:predicted ferric reductase
VKRAIACVGFALVAQAVATRLGLVGDPFPKLAGAWTTSRAAGVTAFAALTLDVVFGLFVSTRMLDRWIPRGASVDVHRWLSGVALALVALHALALLFDASMPFDALDLLVPWQSSYRAGAIALGVFALYGAALVHASFDWRKRIGVRVWRALHFTAFAIFVVAGVHGVLAGSDSSGLRPLYGAALAMVGALVVARIARAARKQPVLR